MNYLRQFQFNEEVTGSYIDTLEAHPEASEKALLLVSHCLNAMKTWLARIQGTECKIKVWQMHEISDMHDLNRSCHDNIYQLLETENLHHVYTYRNSKGEEYSNTLDEILTHLIIHTAHHRAQIAALWSEAGIEPPASDFIFWARNR